MIVETDGSVLIAFAATPPPGDDQACPDNPPAAVTVELTLPLGDRKLRDGRLITTDLTQFIGANRDSAPPPQPNTEDASSVPTT